MVVHIPVDKTKRGVGGRSPRSSTSRGIPQDEEEDRKDGTEVGWFVVEDVQV